MAVVGTKFPYLGNDFKEDHHNELILDINKDAEHVSEVDNVSQAIIRRLNTPLGFYQREPYYGSRVTEYIGKGNSKDTRAEIEDAIMEALTRENRIRAIYSVSVDSAPELGRGNSNPYATLKIAISLKLIDSPSPLSFVYSFYLPTGELQATA